MTSPAPIAATEIDARWPPLSAIVCPALAGGLVVSLVPRTATAAELAVGVAAGGVFALAVWRARRVLLVMGLGSAALFLGAYFELRTVDEAWIGIGTVMGTAMAAVAVVSAPVFVARRHAVASPGTRGPAARGRVALVSAVVLATAAQAISRLVGVEVSVRWAPRIAALGDARVVSFAASVACGVSAMLAIWVLRLEVRGRGDRWRRRAVAACVLALVQAALLTVTVLEWSAHRRALGGVARVAARSLYTCVAQTDGDGACWGTNHFGELGDGATRLRQHPVPIRGVHGIEDLQPPCALLRSGEIRCWEADRGTGDAFVRLSARLPRARLLRVGGFSGCVVSLADEVLCWDGDAIRRVPVNAAGALDLVGGPAYGCVRRPDTIACWASRGWKEDRFRPRDPEAPLVALAPCPAPDDTAAPVPGTARHLTFPGAAIDFRSVHHVEVTSAGRVRAWRLPGSDDETCGPPFDVPGLAEVRALGRGSSSLVLTTGSTLRRWSFQSGVAEMQAPIFDHVVHFDQGSATCAVRDDGTVWCWGLNGFGEVGDGTREERTIPTLVRR